MVQLDILRAYSRRLTNLSSRNRSLLLSSLPAEQFIDLHDLDFLLNKPSFALIDQLLNRKATVPLCDVLDARSERVNEVSKRLRRIARTERFIEEERGAEDLYVGWPFLRGKFADGTVVHGPLLFFPVHLTQATGKWLLTGRSDDWAMLNQTMLLAYSHFNQIKLGEAVLEKDLADFDKDPLVFRTQLYEWLKTTPIELNFNQDLFTDQLQPYDKQTGKSLTTLEHPGELKLYPEAVLGIFPQAGSYLVPDYGELIERGGKGLEAEGIELAVDDHAPPALPPTALALRPERLLHTPLPLDASQEAAIRMVKAGSSLVVQGPPGTGKSQLIANLMADAAANGQRVLLVCQKRAALDVVYDRLKQVGMAPFAALIHDFRNDRKTLYDQIAAQIEQVDAYRSQNYSLDAVLLEREFDTESRRIDQLVCELQAVKDALFDTTECGLSAKELYLTSTPQVDAEGSPALDLSDVYQRFKFDTLDDFLRKLTDYEAYQHRLGKAHPFAERVDFSPFSTADERIAGQLLSQLAGTAQTIGPQLQTLLRQPLTIGQLLGWHEQSSSITALLVLLTGADTDSVWAVMRALPSLTAQTAHQTDNEWLTNLADAWDNALAQPGPEKTLPAAELPAFRALLTDALAVRESWVGWNWWQMTNTGKAQLQRVAFANNLSLSGADLQMLALRVDKRLALDTLHEQARPLLTNLPLPNAPNSLRLLRRAKEANQKMGGLTALHQLPAPIWDTALQFAQTIRALFPLAETVATQRPAWQRYLTDAQIEQVWATPTYAQTLKQSLQSDFDVLVESDKLRAGLTEVEQMVLDRATPATFLNALQLAWIDHIEGQYPELRAVSSPKMAQMEHGLQESVRRKQILSRDILGVRLRDQTFHNLAFNRLNNLVSYRELGHQVSKKRNVWPVRKLLEQYADELFKLVPCWMASPEAVSAMFPLREGLFDLVIFDEASQCYAENGIPAMYRGKQTVVTGDSQQLRPSDLYRVRITDSSEGNADNELPDVAIEVESLLELAAQTLPQIALTGHYRSRSLDLIQFSNTHFYRNQLTLLPDFRDVNAQEPAIRYMNVKGIWQQNTNAVEAEAVLTLIDTLQTELPGRSIGVVTFNFPQQQLIQELLEDAHPASPLSPERETSGAGKVPPWERKGLAVKNIENVQGDEYDVIIFSVGYAPNASGKLSAQFGSLNMTGGENRLNVAITRARERVYVVTSLWPEQLLVAQTANNGPKLLKAYLQYALDVAQGRFRPEPRPIEGLRAGTLLKIRLAAQHPNYQPELPFADLTVREGNAYTALLLTDDDQYYRQSPKEAHAYLPFALEAKHWPFRRVWSREYWRGVRQ